MAVLDSPRLDSSAAVVTPALVLAGVRVRYGSADALSVEALDVRDGETLAVIGPNGSGKSTLLRVLGLLERPTSGEVRFRGRPVDAGSALAERRQMATVFQQPLLADMRVRDNVALGLAFRGVPPAARAPRVLRWLERFGVAALASRRATTLSGGEAQRVALARALVVEPTVLLLDEPFAALDEPTRQALVADLGAILRADRVTTVLVTHDRGEAQALADRVAVLLDGRVHQLDDAARVFSAPASEPVARFVGVETIVAGEVVGEAGGVTIVGVAGRTIEVAGAATRGAHVRVCIRPEDVTLAQPAEHAARSSARNHLAGTITTITPAAGHVRIVVDCGFPLVAAVTSRSVTELGLRPGARVVAIFKASAAHLLSGRP
ncbi:MAG: ABC transporter ATP-binding protein [Candidatus Rokubacteria bacterium]|nr:ABC transporter ATP-binding protein [Candidatus Rokubacteria bacterium]